jgi:IrrE N-terminal-like domain
LTILVKQRSRKEYVQVPLRYKLILNSSHSVETKYATLVHELAHLYCGHLGTPNEKWWPDRRDLSHEVQEFEAESICYLVCKRLGIENPSEKYLTSLLAKNETGDVPPISLECVMKSAGLIEQMGRERSKPRKESEQ